MKIGQQLISIRQKNDHCITQITSYFNLLDCQMLRSLLLISLLCYTLCCHYTCDTCYAGQQFTHCKVCKYNKTMTFINSIVVQDDNSLFKSVVPVGICSQPPIYFPNFFGITILVLGALGYAITQKSYSLQYMSTLQNLAFLGLLEIGFSNPGAYVWQGLRYFLIFTATNSNGRIQNTQLTVQDKYNIQKFIKDPTYLQNLPLIITTNILVGLIVFDVFRKLFKCGQECATNCEKILRTIERFARLSFFYLIAENLWVIMMGFKYGSAGMEEYLLFGLYFLQLLLFVIYLKYQPIRIAVNDSKIRMYWQLFKKVVFPLITIFNIPQIILPCVMIGMFVIETIFEIIALNKRHWKTYLYKTLEGVTLLTFTLFVIGDQFISLWDYSEVFSWIIAFALGFYSCIPIIQIIAFLAKKCPQFSSTKGQMVHQISDNAHHPHVQIPTEMTLPDVAPNEAKVFRMPAVMSQANIDEKQKQNNEEINKSLNNPSMVMVKGRVPIKSHSQTSALRSKPDLIKSQEQKKEKSLSTKSHKLIVNEFAQQEKNNKKQKQVQESNKQTIQVIKLDEILKNDKTVTLKQSRSKEEMFIKNNLKDDKSMTRNMSDLKKGDFNKYYMYTNPLQAREKRRINRKKRLMDDGVEENEWKNGQKGREDEQKEKEERYEEDEDQ